MGSSHEGPGGPDLALGISSEDIPPGSFLAGHVNGEAVLVSKVDEEYYAVSATCTHYGGPLSKGFVDGATVRCPWHHACFSLKTGAALKAPAFDGLQQWMIEAKEGRIFVRTKMESSTSPLQAIASHLRKIVIVGGGAAGFAAAEMLRRQGFKGQVTMLSDDSSPPCDRPNLSKDYLAGTASEDWLPLKPPEFYEEHRIDLHLNVRVDRIDSKGKIAITEEGFAYPFDALLIATGAEPIRLNAKGFDRPNVYTLRSVDDAERIIAKCATANCVAVIGASFIGLEVAASLIKRGLKVHVIAPEEIPMAKVLGPGVGRFVKNLHKEHAVHFHLGHTATEFDGECLTLDDETTLKVDFVVVGVGVKPRTTLADRSGLVVDNGIVVDKYLETSVPGIFAAGDVANYVAPNGERLRLEHWVVAERQGQTAALNMLGQQQVFAEVPFFWSRHFHSSILYVGHSSEWDETSVSGSVSAGDCSVRLRRNGRTEAVVTIGRPMESMVEEARLESELQQFTPSKQSCDYPPIRGH